MKALFLILVGFCALSNQSVAQSLHWKLLDDSYIVTDQFSSFAVNNSFLFTGSSKGVARSSDNGDTWEFSSKIYPENFEDGVEALVAHKNMLFAATDSGAVFRSTNNGDSWVEADKGLPRFYRTLNFSLASIGTVLFAGLESGGVYRSTDNGETWTSANNGIRDTTTFLRFGTRGKTILTGGDDGIYRSIDEGETWTKQSNANVAVRFASNSRYCYATTTQYGLIQSSNDGITWNPVNSNLELGYFNIAVNESRIINANPDKIYQSVNNGETWTKETDGLYAGFIYGVYINDNSAFAMSGDGVFRADISVGVDENLNEPDGIHLFPNPTSTQFTLSGVEDGASVRVVNSLGEEVKQFTHVSSLSSQYSIDVSDLVSGLYFVSIRTAKGAVVKPMMVNR